jgi:putative DNA-invertase from lambdoid prophage Rac
MLSSGVSLPGTRRPRVSERTSGTRAQLDHMRAMLSQEAVGIARIAEETRQTIYRIKDDPTGSEAALAAWGL